MQVYSKCKMSLFIAIFSKDALPYKLLKADCLYFMTPWVKYNTCLVCYIYNNKKPQLLKCMNGKIGLPKNRICLPPPQCVELALRWQFCVHGSICHEIYIESKFWIIFDFLNSQSWLWLTRKHIWNIIEEIVFKRSKKLLCLKTISSI